MPIIKCACPVCSHSFHELVRWGQLSARVCPKCGRGDVEVESLDVMKDCPRLSLFPLQLSQGKLA